MLRTVLYLGVWVMSLSASSVLAQSYQITEISSGESVVTKNRPVVTDLGGWHYVKKIVVEAEGIGKDSMVEVWVNGDLKGTIYAPGRDPQYTVTIGEAAQRIVFKHVSGARMRILSTYAWLSDEIDLPGGGTGIVNANIAIKISKGVIGLSRKISATDIDAYNFTTYLLPVKVAAGRVLASAKPSGRDYLSERVRIQLKSLVAQISHADPLIDRMLSEEQTFEFAVDLLTYKEQILNLLN